MKLTKIVLHYTEDGQWDRVITINRENISFPDKTPFPREIRTASRFYEYLRAQGLGDEKAFAVITEEPTT